MITTFMTFNIQTCRNYHTRAIEVDLMADTIKNTRAEIIGLNEVFGDGPNQATLIADKLGYRHHYFAQAIVAKGRPSATR